MAYSIYFYIKPSALDLIDSVSDDHVLAFLKSNFTEQYEREKIYEEGLFSWIKPRKDEDRERNLFDALSFLHQQKLLNEISANDYKNELPIIEKLKKYRHTELISISKDV